MRVTVIVAVLLAGVLALVLGTLVANRVPLFDPPGPALRLARYLRGNVAEVSPQSLFPELRSPRYALPPGEVLEALAASARELGYEDVEVDAAALRMRAVVATPLLGFRDDIEVEIRERDGHAEILARSASRLGRADFGANQKHLRRLLSALARRLGAEPAR